MYACAVGANKLGYCCVSAVSGYVHLIAGQNQKDDVPLISS